MTTYSKFNFVYRLQKWMDSVPGQTFLNYAYSWGASIVILGTLFKLTHLPGANFFLFLGMGTEVFVFFISAFDRPFDKTTDGMELDTHVATAEDQVEPATSAVAAAATPATVIGGNGGTIIIGGGSVGSGVPSPAGETSESSETSVSSEYSVSRLLLPRTFFVRLLRWTHFFRTFFSTKIKKEFPFFKIDLQNTQS